MTKVRCWESELTSTVVQFRTDADPMVYLHTNLGWVPIGNTPKDPKEAEKFAEECARGYDLQESKKSRAYWLAGLTPDDWTCKCGHENEGWHDECESCGKSCSA